MSTVRIATRTSDLALAQARMIAAELERRLGVAAELVPLKTTGDRLHIDLKVEGERPFLSYPIDPKLKAGSGDVVSTLQMGDIAGSINGWVTTRYGAFRRAILLESRGNRRRWSHH